MAKFELSISDKYVPTWNIWEGVREIIQNALDARQDGHDMTVSHSGSTLSVASRGVTLERNFWLMGQTTKAEGGYRGCFGEGGTLGILALIRAGRKVRILNGAETWHASIQESATFNQPVLTINTRAASTPSEDFTVEVELSAGEWQDFRPRFLDLLEFCAAIDAASSQILTTPEYQGRLYVKGIWVENKDRCAYGWNFRSAGTDRDRRMINTYDLPYYTGKALQQALVDGALKPIDVLCHLQDGAHDVTGLAEFHCGDEAKQLLIQAFRELYGEKAIPVSGSSGVSEAGHYGLTGIIVSREVGMLFRESELDLEVIKKSAKADATATYLLGDLRPAERNTYTLVNALVEAAAQPLGHAPLTGRLSIVDFRDPDIKGTSTYDPEAKRHNIQIAREALESFERYLQILVHEVAHDRGGDGDVHHERAEGLLFSRIITRAMDGYLPREFRTATQA